MLIARVFESDNPFKGETGRTRKTGPDMEWIKDDKFVAKLTTEIPDDAAVPEGWSKVDIMSREELKTERC